MGFATPKLQRDEITQSAENPVVWWVPIYAETCLGRGSERGGKAYFEIRTDEQTNENKRLPASSPPTFELEQDAHERRAIPVDTMPNNVCVIRAPKFEDRGALG